MSDTSGVGFLSAAECRVLCCVMLTVMVYERWWKYVAHGGGVGWGCWFCSTRCQALPGCVVCQTSLGWTTRRTGGCRSWSFFVFLSISSSLSLPYRFSPPSVLQFPSAHYRSLLPFLLFHPVPSPHFMQLQGLLGALWAPQLGELPRAPAGFVFQGRANGEPRPKR